MTVKYSLLILVCIVLCSCNTNAFKNATDPEAYADSIRHYGLSQLKIANSNDPVCGMPTSQGFDDTTLFQGKLIGFCSRKCKDDFQKNPAAFAIKFK